MPHVEHLVIACAGVGSRLGLGKPKALLDLQGQTLIHRLLRATRRVPNVRIVVGYMEEEVSAEVFRSRPDAVIVRNPDYLSTSTLSSFAMGCEGLRSPTLFMDGDLVISAAEFERFRAEAGQRASLYGHCAARSDDPVYVHLSRDGQHIAQFSRTQPSEREWASVFCCDPRATFHSRPLVDRRAGSVFEWVAAEGLLPAAPIEVFEIDTPRDLAHWQLLQKAQGTAARAAREATSLHLEALAREARESLLDTPAGLPAAPLLPMLGAARRRSGKSAARR